MKPEDPPVTAPFVLKKIRGGIRKCAGCSKAIMNDVIGYNHAFDSQCCLARHEAYYYWDSTTDNYKLTSGTRHYHINPVCIKSYLIATKKISKGGLEVSAILVGLLKDRFHQFEITD